MKFVLVCSLLLLCSMFCGSSSQNNDQIEAAVDTIEKKQSSPKNRRLKVELVKKDSDWSAWKTDTATGRKFFLIDDTSSILKDEKKLMERAANFAYYIQGRRWCGKPIKIAIFSRIPPVLCPDTYYYYKVGRGMYIKKDPPPPPWPEPKYEYVGNKNDIMPKHKEEWKNRYIADYDCEADTITFYPANPIKKRSVYLLWKGHRFTRHGVRVGEDHPNALFKLDTIR